jgi:hypothetical protein
MLEGGERLGCVHTIVPERRLSLPPSNVEDMMDVFTIRIYGPQYVSGPLQFVVVAAYASDVLDVDMALADDWLEFVEGWTAGSSPTTSTTRAMTATNTTTAIRRAMRIEFR